MILSQSPLPICAFFSRTDHLWHVRSINGAPVPEADFPKTCFEDSAHVVRPLVLRAHNNLEKLVYGTDRGFIIMRHLPTMIKYRRLQVSKETPVLTLLTSPDKRFLLIGCGDGGLVVTTERCDSSQTTLAPMNLFKPLLG